MIEGKWHAEGSAASHTARLLVRNEIDYTLQIADGSSYEGKLSELQVGNRLGNIQRKIVFQDGSVFSTSDNDGVDRLFEHRLKTNRLIHTLESKFRWVVLSVVIAVLTTFAFFKWGVPWSSKLIAHALPEKTNAIIAENTLDFLDKFMFQKSSISSEKQEEIRQHFHTTVAPLGVENKKINYTLHFRKWGDGNVSIPNALALPSGDIILTDKFVELCDTQEEMDSVLLHEMGHVVHRHTLEMVIEGTFVSVVVMMTVGDTSGLADIGVGLGSALVSSAYSRGHESEADTYAFEHMLKAKMDPAAFSRIMDRMTSYMQEQGHPKKDKRDEKTTVESQEDYLDYLSSHPNTKERIEIANQYSECFKKGLSECEIRLED